MSAESGPALVSVVVPVRDAERTLDGTLAGLRRQTYEGEWEAIVVDNGSRDATGSVARRELATLPGGRIVEAGARRGSAPARNAGAAAARGGLIAFCDGDDVPDPGWLSALVECAADADVVAGAVHIDRLNEPRTRAAHPAPPRHRPQVGYGFLPFAQGGNCAVRADVFRSLGGMDERFRFGQDVDFCWRAQLACYRLTFAPQAVVHRRLREGTAAICRQQFRWGVAATHLYARYRGHGMPGSGLARAARDWVAVALGTPLALAFVGVRAEWGRKLGMRLGRVAGSVRYGVIYP